MTTTDRTLPMPSQVDAPAMGRRAEIALFGLALLMVPVVVVQVVAQDAALLLAAEIANTAIWLAFALELVYLLIRATDRGAVLRERWLDAAIVVLAPPLFIPPEVASLRVLRMLRLLRLVAIAVRLRRRSAHVLGSEGIVYVGFVVFLVVFVGGVSLHQIEPEIVPTLWDGFWFVLVTLTTVGYGDITPRTFEGRVLAGAVMLVGLGVFATLTAALGQVLFRGHGDDDRLADLERRVEELTPRPK